MLALNYADLEFFFFFSNLGSCSPLMESNGIDENS